MTVSRDLILTKLNETEAQERVKILYAVESGSRAWGFESTDSDYDVRFIYVRPMEWYLALEEGRDVIEYPVSELLDINGWDIKKALLLFRKSNPPLYEWLSSPIVYLPGDVFVHRLRELIPDFYSPIASMHHYLSMAKTNYKAYMMGPKVKMKKYFYALRPIFACMWIEKYRSMPAMEFETIFKDQPLDSQLVAEIERLLVIKRSGAEMDLEDRIEIIHDFVAEKITYFEEKARTMDPAPKTSTEVLDELFRETVLA